MRAPTSREWITVPRAAWRVLHAKRNSSASRSRCDSRKTPYSASVSVKISPSRAEIIFSAASACEPQPQNPLLAVHLHRVFADHFRKFSGSGAPHSCPSATAVLRVTYLAQKISLRACRLNRGNACPSRPRAPWQKFPAGDTASSCGRGRARDPVEPPDAAMSATSRRQTVCTGPGARGWRRRTWNGCGPAIAGRPGGDRHSHDCRGAFAPDNRVSRENSSHSPQRWASKAECWLSVWRNPCSPSIMCGTLGVLLFILSVRAGQHAAERIDDQDDHSQESIREAEGIFLQASQTRWLETDRAAQTQFCGPSWNSEHLSTDELHRLVKKTDPRIGFNNRFTGR